MDSDDVASRVRLILEQGWTEDAAVWPLFRVGFNMLGRLLSRCEPGGAHLGSVSFHRIVAFKMIDVIRQVGKRSAALFALDHLPNVHALMWHHGTPQFERLPAEVTHIRRGILVLPAVPHQTTPMTKRPATVVTNEWPLPRVHSLMARHMTEMVCGVLARLTPVFAVPADVAVAVLHVPVQTILSQTGIVAVDTVMYLRLPTFTWRGQECGVTRNVLWQTLCNGRTTVLLRFRGDRGTLCHGAHSVSGVF